MDVFSRREVHHGVGPPLRGPAHFFDLLFDAGGNGTVADVRIDFNQKIPPDNHGLELGMIDVCRNDRPSSCHFLAHKFRSDLSGNALWESAKNGRRKIALHALRGARVLLVQTIAQDIVR